MNQLSGIVEKYLHRSDHERREMVGRNIWTFAVLVKELLAPNKFDWKTGKAVLADVQAFSTGEMLKNNGTDEEKADVAQIIVLLEERMFKYNMWRCTAATRELSSPGSFNRDKLSKTHAEVVDIAESDWLNEHGTAKQRRDVERLLDQLESLNTASCG